MIPRTLCDDVEGTAVASPRVVIQILGNYQNADGGLTTSDVRRPYRNGLDVVSAE